MTAMTHLDKEIAALRNNLIEMFLLVQKQLRKSLKALLEQDKNLAREVLFNERRVNAEELKIDKDCENFVALFNPVAIDL
ncbi:MAG TPA: PhoU domain-containing protein, partial [Chitinophagales bacterium]|nr:PhoU domain-containing protein [Chitinophagales bacterium]